MARTLPAYAITEKNKLAQAGAFLNLVQIDITGESAIRLAQNTEDVSWDGETYSAWPMQLGEVQENLTGRTGTTTLKLSNVTRALEPYLQDHAGCVGAVVTITVVHSDHLAEATPVLSDVFTVLDAQSDENWVAFTIGGSEPFSRRFPRDRYISTVCRHVFKGPLCLYAGADATCDHTLVDCKSKLNQVQYGGSPGIAEGVYG